jgi:hypothetical protein
MFAFILLVLAVTPVVVTIGYTDYDNDFLDPAYILSGDFNISTAGAQQSIIEWADMLAAQGPWCEHVILDAQLSTLFFHEDGCVC